MSKRRKFFIIFYIPIIVSFCLLTGISDLYLSLRNDCNMRDTITPFIASYPNSTPVQSRKEDNLTNKHRTTDYMVEDSLVDIVDFYAQYGECNPFSDKYICFGHLQPFGVYTIEIRQQSENITAYNIEIRWDICPEGDSVEYSPVE